MNIIIKNKDDILKIKQACAIWKIVRKELRSFVKEGVSLNEIDLLAKNIIETNNAKCAFYGAYGFPKNICISVNDCIIHGVPNDYILKDKDIVTFDIGVNYMDHICDAAFTMVIGENEEAQKINKVCRDSLDEVSKILKPGISNLQIGKFINDFVESNGYKVIHDFTGHGCGNSLHEDPIIPNYVNPYFPKVNLRENMVICIEPMIMTDSNEYYIDSENHWNVYSKNHKLTCHWEDMFLITRDGCEILTSED